MPGIDQAGGVSYHRVSGIRTKSPSSSACPRTCGHAGRRAGQGSESCCERRVAALRVLYEAPETRHQQRLLLATTLISDSRSLAGRRRRRRLRTDRPRGSCRCQWIRATAGGALVRAAADRLNLGRDTDAPCWIAPGTCAARAEHCGLAGPIADRLGLAGGPAGPWSSRPPSWRMSTRPTPLSALQRPCRSPGYRAQVATHFDDVAALPYFGALPGESGLAIRSQTLQRVRSSFPAGAQGGGRGRICALSTTHPWTTMQESDLPSLIRRLRHNGHRTVASDDQHLYGRTVVDLRASLTAGADMTPQRGPAHSRLPHRSCRARRLGPDPAHGRVHRRHRDRRDKIRRQAQRDGVADTCRPGHHADGCCQVSLYGYSLTGASRPSRPTTASPCSSRRLPHRSRDPGHRRRAFERLSLGDDQADTLAPLLTCSIAPSSRRQVHHLRQRSRSCTGIRSTRWLTGTWPPGSPRSTC